MALKIKKRYLYNFLFALCVGVPYLNNYELTFSIWLFALAITIQQRYSLTIVKQAALFAAIFLIGLTVTMFKDYQAYFIIRDITYMIKPVIGLLLGYQLCRKNFNNAFETIAHTGFIIALIHIGVLITALVVFKAFTLNDLRFHGGYFSDFEVYVLVILLFHKRFEINFSRKRLLWYTWIIGFSAFMYLARTNFIQFVVLFLALKGYFRITPRAVITVVSVIVLAVIGYSTILYINPKRNGPGMEAFLYKIKVAPIEPFKTRINRDDWKDFNDNYRSYENIITVQQVSAAGTQALIFGEGIGSKVDLKQKVWLGDMELRYISILHNGYMTVLLKSGLVGVSLLLITIWLLFQNPRSQIPIIRQINLLMVGSGVFMIASYWVFMGYYFIADTKALLLGFLICYREMRIKQEASKP